MPGKIVHGGARVGRRQIVQADQPIGGADGEPAPVGRVGRGHHIRLVTVQRQACGGAQLPAYAVDRAEQPDRVVGLQRRRINGEQQAALRARRRVARMAGDLLDLLDPGSASSARAVRRCDLLRGLRVLSVPVAIFCTAASWPMPAAAIEPQVMIRRVLSPCGGSSASARSMLA